MYIKNSYELHIIPFFIRYSKSFATSIADVQKYLNASELLKSKKYLRIEILEVVKTFIVLHTREAFKTETLFLWLTHTHTQNRRWTWKRWEGVLVLYHINILTGIFSWTILWCFSVHLVWHFTQSFLFFFALSFWQTSVNFIFRGCNYIKANKLKCFIASINNISSIWLLPIWSWRWHSIRCWCCNDVWCYKCELLANG